MDSKRSRTEPAPTDERAREAAARIRAVRNYADMTQQALANALGVSLATMKRIESGTRPISTDELLAIGGACNAPAQFMLHGYAAIPDTPQAEMPVNCIRRFATIELRLGDIEKQLRRLYTGDDPESSHHN